MTLVKSETAPTARAARVFESTWYRSVVLIIGLELAVFWFILGPASPFYAVGVAGWTFALGPAAATPLLRRIPRTWFRVPPWESGVHLVLGVGLFAWLLELSRWNRHVAGPMRAFSGGRSGLESLEESLHLTALAHEIGVAIHLLLAVFALFGKYPLRGAMWMFVPGVLVHVYPVLLQRSITLRLQRLLARD